MTERFCTDQKQLKIFKISFHKKTIAAKENQKAGSEQQQKYILKILSIAQWNQQSQGTDFSEQITIKSILPLPAIILFAQTGRNHFPKNENLMNYITQLPQVTNITDIYPDEVDVAHLTSTKPGAPITILSVKKRQIKFTWPTQKKLETLLNVGLRIHMNLIMNQLQPHTYASMKVWLLRFEGYLKMPELNQRKGIIAS